MAAKGETPHSDIPRWVRTSRERPRWDERNRMIAAYVPPGTAVVDLGSGAQTLADHLPEGCRYQPCDVVPGPGVVLCDLDADRWPALDHRYDIAVCSGVLEYLQDVPKVLAGLAGPASRAIVTYSDRGRAQKIDTRLRQGWRSHLTLPELRAALDSLDAEWRFLTEWRSHILCAIDFEPGLPPLRDGDALIEEAAWESSFARLEGYARRTGDARVPNSLVEGGVGLGAWVQAQRRLRRRGTLSARRTARLEAVPGWSWRATRQAANGAPQVARDQGLAPGSLRPERIEGDRLDWMCHAAQGDPVLDIACGQGTAVIMLARAGLHVVGFDRDTEALEQAKARLSEETPETRRRLTLVTGDDGPLPLRDDSFDTVLLADVVERADDTETLIDEARRLVRVRGRVVVTSPLDVAPRARSSLGRLVQALSVGLRPIQIVDGDRWVGVVAVFADAGERTAEPWSALLEVAENRLSRLGEAYADRAVQLEETREREHALGERMEALVSAAAGNEQVAEERRRQAADAEARLEATEKEAKELRVRLAVADTVAAEAGRRADAEADRRAELESSLEAERERLRGLSVQLGAEQADRAADRRRRDELAARLDDERGRRAGLEARVADADARAAEAEREADDAQAHAAEVTARAAEEAEARERRLAEVRADGRAVAFESERRQELIDTLEAELRSVRDEHLREASRAALLAERLTVLVAEAERGAGRAPGLEDALASARARVREVERERTDLAGRLAALDDELARRDRQTAQRGRATAAREHEAAAALAAAQAELSRLREELTDARAELRMQTARAHRRARQVESLKAGKAYRWSARWWRVRRSILHPRGGGAKPPAKD